VPLRLLAICSPQFPGLPRLRAEAEAHQLELTLAHDLAGVLHTAGQAEAIFYTALAGATPPFAQVWPHTSPALRWVHSFEAGVDRLLTPGLVASPVLVTNARGVYVESLAEFAIYGVLHFYKKGLLMAEQQRRQQWRQFEVDTLRGKRMGILGYGTIGQACGRAGAAFGMEIDPVRHRDRLSRADLHAWLGRLDVLVAAAPRTRDTWHLVGAKELAALPRTAIVVNVGRGEVIDEAALVAALQSGTVAGAALDVFETEPLPAGHPYWHMDNVLISPHCTDRTVHPHWIDLGMNAFAENLRCFLERRPFFSLVDKQAGY